MNFSIIKVKKHSLFIENGELESKVKRMIDKTFSETKDGTLTGFVVIQNAQNSTYGIFQTRSLLWLVVGPVMGACRIKLMPV